MGFSKELGPIFYQNEDGMGAIKGVSEESQKLIDTEMRKIIDRNYNRAKQTLEDNMDILHAMKDALLKYETLDRKQIDDLMARVQWESHQVGMINQHKVHHKIIKQKRQKNLFEQI